MDQTPYLPLEECQDRTLYRIKARNLRIGVYVEALQGFTGIRYKFGNEFLDTEIHWDYGRGTAQPIEAIGLLPAGIGLDTYLGTVDDEGEPVTYKEDVPGATPRKGEWYRADGTPCVGTPWAKQNQPLFDYLKTLLED